MFLEAVVVELSFSYNKLKSPAFTSQAWHSMRFPELRIEKDGGFSPFYWDMLKVGKLSEGVSMP